jgi:DNA-binding transcriptional ArsR family regulator
LNITRASRQSCPSEYPPDCVEEVFAAVSLFATRLLDPTSPTCYALYNVSTDVGVCIVSQDRCDLICIDAPRAEAIRAKLLGEGAALEAAERAKALSDPTRLTLAEALREGEELCVCDLSWIAGRSQNLVSHHLGALRARGLVRSRRDGKMVMYSLTPVGRSLLGVVVGVPVGDPA